jgi:hypothetical protein
VSVDLDVIPLANRYFPAIELREDDFVTGYVVPALSAIGSGKICVAGTCTRIHDAAAYHDHNWGVWRDVTWEWGIAHGSKLSLLYGGVYTPEQNPPTGTPRSSSPFFLTCVDSLGVKQVLRFTTIEYSGNREASGAARATAPRAFSLVAAQGSDTLRLHVRVLDALATPMGSGAFQRVFLQMRGSFVLSGRSEGQTVADSGTGFFETYRR